MKILGKEPAIIIGGIAAAVSIAVGYDLSDGLSLAEAGGIAAPILAVFGIRAKVWSEDSVDDLQRREFDIGYAAGEAAEIRRRRGLGSTQTRHP